MCKVCDRDSSSSEVKNAQSVYNCLGIGALNMEQIEYLLSNGDKESQDHISAIILNLHLIQSGRGNERV
jgi:hypothetical protein